MSETCLRADIDGPAGPAGLSEDELAGSSRRRCASTSSTRSGRSAATSARTSAPASSRSRCTRVLESPQDKILWDVGHQAYPHKVLTGRRDELPTIRQYGGLAPFCSREESEHDIMGAGHASTVDRLRGRHQGGHAPARRRAADGKVVAVIGDGAMTGGVAFEAIGQAGGLGTPIVVVLNDNGMSIAPNVGALSRYFNRVRLNPKLWHAREGVEGGLTRLPGGHRRGLRAARPAAEGVDQGLLGARPVVGGARLGLHGRHRRPRRERAARGAAARRSRPNGRSSCTSRPSRARASRRPRTAAWRAWRSGTRPSRSRSRTAAAPHAPPRMPRRRAAGKAARRRSTRRCSATRSCASASATSAWSASPRR